MPSLSVACVLAYVSIKHSDRNTHSHTHTHTTRYGCSRVLRLFSLFICDSDRRPEARDVFTQLQSNTSAHGAVNTSSTNVVGSAVPLCISQVQLEQRVLACEEQMAELAHMIMSVRDRIENAQRRADVLGRKLHKKGKVLAKEASARLCAKPLCTKQYGVWI